MIGTIKFPTLIGLTLIIVGLAAAVIAVRREQDVGSRAAGGGLTPGSVSVSNISDQGFSVSWTTDAPVTGFVQLDDGTTTTRFFDDRDTDEKPATASSTHLVSVRGLAPATTYTFRVGKGDGSLFDQDGTPFRTTTGPALSSPPPPDTAQGLILTSQNAPAADAIISVELPDGQALSALSTTSGNWIIPLSVARTVDLSDWLSYDRTATTYTLRVDGGVHGKAEAKVTTAGDRPVPPIVLGQTYDFRQSKTPIGFMAERPTVTSSPEPIIVGELPTDRVATNFDLSPFSVPVKAASEVTLDNPAREGEVVATTRPEFFGAGPAGVALDILVESSDPVSATVLVSESGQWRFSFPQELAPGEHLVTLSWSDPEGVVQRLTRTFVVNAQVGGPSFTATDGATPTPSTTPPPAGGPSPTPTPSPSSGPSATPTSSPTPTVPPQTVVPPDTGQPVSGNLTPSLLLFMMGMALVGSGFAMIRLRTRDGRS